MNVKTFKARTLNDALCLVRDELGPDARILSTGKKPSGLWQRLTGGGSVEVTALQAEKPSRTLEEATPPRHVATIEALRHSVNPSGLRMRQPPEHASVETPSQIPHAATDESYRARFRRYATEEDSGSLLESMMAQHDHGTLERPANRMPSTLFRLFTDLIDADVDDRFARELIDDLHQNSTPAELSDFDTVHEKAVERLTSRIRVAPTIGSYPNQRRVVALIGPTGVGKTTTIAKLAANLRLRDKRRVGLITVDTYRMAAVDQLRAYADIIDLPMEVVTTPREMRDAVSTLADLDLVLIDTAGRSPRDEIQIQELKAMLSEARPDEVQLVLSSVCNARHLTRLVEQFQPVSPTSLLLTKLDESVSFGHLLPILCNDRIPLSYTTHGQNVPDDIQPADAPKLIESVFNS